MTRLRISSQQLPGEHRKRLRASLQPVTGPLLEAGKVRIFPFDAFQILICTFIPYFFPHFKENFSVHRRKNIAYGRKKCYTMTKYFSLKGGEGYGDHYGIPGA